LPPGAPSFAKPRSAEVYARIISNRPEDWQVAARDMAFVMGDDQTILVETAYQHQSEQLRLAAVKILSRKRTPEARAILEQMAGDANELVRSLVEKTLLLNK
jgi:HEAT repeat protein